MLNSYRNDYYRDVVAAAKYSVTRTPVGNWWSSEAVDCGEFHSQGIGDMGSVKFGLTKESIEQVDQFTKSETSGLIFDGIKDVVIPAALTAMTGGAYAAITVSYDVATLAYDMNKAMEEIQSPEDQLKCICIEDAGSQISERSLQACSQAVLENIDANADLLYQQIERDL